MNILVLGGAGFIGSNLCRRSLYQSRDNFVICMDNLITGNMDNINDLLQYSNFHFIEHNVIESIKMEMKIDRIYNLDCAASPISYQINPIATAKTNFIGTLNALECARENNAVILQASTSEIYGNPLEHPQKESYLGNVNTIGPRACYDEGKRIAETLCMDYYRQYHVDAKIVRIFNTYGPGMQKSDGRVIPNFICNALEEKTIYLYGDGSQTRSFCYISDLLDGIEKLICSELHVPVNLGNPEEVTIRELASLVLELTGSKSELKFKVLPEDDPIKRRPDIMRAKVGLGWKPKVELKQGLQKTIDYFRNIMQ